MPTRRPLIAGNWKMNGLRSDGLALAAAVVKDIGKPGAVACELLVCPPTTLIAAVAETLRGSAVAVGGQDCHIKPSGAHTGDISAAMLRDAGAAYVIVGHSERRTDHGETDALVQAKANAGYAAGLSVVICIGETEAERDGGRTLDVLARQIAGSVPQQANATDTVIAYEPVWAIGTGRTPTSAEIAAAHGHIRDRLAARIGAQAEIMRILYGGSVKAGNAAEILRLDHVDGALVGGASLAAADFCAIARGCP